MMPESWSSRSARLTVGREAPNTFTSSDSLGSRWPAWYSPEEMASLRVCRIRSCFDTSDLVATLLIIQALAWPPPLNLASGILRREVAQVFPPVHPRVCARALGKRHAEAVSGEHVDGGLAGADEAVVLPRTEPDGLQSTLHCCRIERAAVRRFPLRQRFAKDPRAEHANRGEPIQVGEGDGERLTSTHRQPRNRAMTTTGRRSVMTLDVRHQIGLELTRKLRELGTQSWSTAR